MRELTRSVVALDHLVGHVARPELFHHVRPKLVADVTLDVERTHHSMLHQVEATEVRVSFLLLLLLLQIRLFMKFDKKKNERKIDQPFLSCLSISMGIGSPVCRCALTMAITSGW